MPLDPEQRVNNGNYYSDHVPMPAGSASLVNGVITPNGPTGPDLNKFLDFPIGGGTPDHFMDVNPLDQAAFDETVRQNKINNDFNSAQFNWKKAQDDRDYALAIGDQALARQKQSDANYWQGQTLAAQERISNAGNASSERIAAGNNAASIQGHQIDAQAAIQSATIRAQQDRYNSDLNFQANMANASNDQERNRISLIHEQEYAAISKMEDDTKRAIAGQQANIDAFNAESTRQYQQGDLALKNNQFLLDASSTPRDLFGLYFMQRGYSPDWQTMANGGTPAQGDALAPVNPMKAYVPNVQLPTNFNLGAGPAYGSVGNASNTTMNSNPFITATPNAQAPNFAASGGGGGGGMSTFSGSGGGVTSSVPQGNGTGSFEKFVDYGQPPQLPLPYTDINPGGLQGGVPLAGLKPGMNLSTVGGSGALGSDFTMPAYYDQGKTRAIGAGDQIGAGTQVWVDYPGAAPATPNTTTAPPPRAPVQLGMPAMASGGFTTSPRIMTGDATSSNPFAGGARPEIIENPTGAPLRVKNTMQTALDYGAMPRYAGGTDNLLQTLIALLMSKNAGGQPQPQMQPQQGPEPQQAQPQGMPQQQQSPQQQGGANAAIQSLLARNNQANQMMGAGTGVPQRTPDNPELTNAVNAGRGFQTPRFALGTDVSQQYQDAGLGQLYINSSNNSNTSGMDLPPWLQTLGDYGVPLAPSLVSAATGGNMNPLNVGSAVSQRGGGALASLSTLGKMTTGERDLLKGYEEGPVGVPWQDIMDYIGGTTANLGSAKRSVGGM